MGRWKMGRWLLEIETLENEALTTATLNRNDGAKNHKVCTLFNLLVWKQLGGTWEVSLTGRHVGQNAIYKFKTSWSLAAAKLECGS